MTNCWTLVLLQREGLRTSKQNVSLLGHLASRSHGEEGIEDDMLRLQLTLQLKQASFHATKDVEQRCI